MDAMDTDRNVYGQRRDVEERQMSHKGVLAVAAIAVVIIGIVVAIMSATETRRPSGQLESADPGTLLISGEERAAIERRLSAASSTAPSEEKRRRIQERLGAFRGPATSTLSDEERAAIEGRLSR